MARWSNNTHVLPRRPSRAWLTGNTTINAARFTVDPAPDYTEQTAAT
jgi:hypothetical protein